MLVQYIRQGNKPFACVVAIGAGQVGWSLCHPKDSFNKKRAVEIASGRANYLECIGEKALSKIPDYPVLFDSSPNELSTDIVSQRVLIKEAIDQMTERSYRYFTDVPVC